MKIEQYAFLRKRKELLKFWNIIGFLTLMAIISIALWMILNSPLLIIPFQAITKVEQGILQQSTLEMMALFLPIIVIMFFLLLFLLVSIMYLFSSHEKKYITIIEELLETFT